VIIDIRKMWKIVENKSKKRAQRKPCDFLQTLVFVGA
jgi:hypothetical protein